MQDLFSFAVFGGITIVVYAIGLAVIYLVGGELRPSTDSVLWGMAGGLGAMLLLWAYLFLDSVAHRRKPVRNGLVGLGLVLISAWLHGTIFVPDTRTGYAILCIGGLGVVSIISGCVYASIDPVEEKWSLPEEATPSLAETQGESKKDR